MTEIEKSFYLDQNSLALLLTGKGVNSLRCFDLFGKEINVDDAQACVTLYSLVQEGIAKVCEDEFELDSDLNNMIETMIHSKKILAVYSGDKILSNIAFYIGGDTAVSIEQNTERNAFLKLSVIQTENIFDFISQRHLKNMQNDVLVEDIKDSKDIYLNSLSLLTVNDDFEKILCSNDTYLFFDFINSLLDKSYCDIALIRSKLGPVIYEWKKETVHSQFYTYKGLLNIFKRCLEEQ